MRTSLLITCSVLIVCSRMSFSAQDPDADSGTSTQPSLAQSAPPHGNYSSGFEVSSGRGPMVATYGGQVLDAVRRNWYPKIEQLQKSIGTKQGATVVELKIREDGSVEKMQTVKSAGDRAFDAAVTEGISSSAPFHLLPKNQPKNSFALKMFFGYGQPAKPGAPFCEGPNNGAHAEAYSLLKVNRGITPPRATYSPDPEYSEKARREKYISNVQLAGTVDRQGDFTDLCVMQAGGEGLDEKAIESVKNWKFSPATKEGEPVAVRILVEVTFHLY